MDWKRLYSGYLATPFLWSGELHGLRQFELEDFPTPALQPLGNPRMLLGTLAEQFSFDYWKNAPNLELIAKNIQINGKAETIGEIDTVLRYKNTIYHVEITYKVYLYDPNISEDPMECWIGPNRWDRLMKKLHRIRSHQLPLLHRPETLTALPSLISTEQDIQQRVWAKGLLFLPEDQEIDVSPLNPECIAGTYISEQTLKKYKTERFFLPTKPEWMIVPHTAVDWLSYEALQQRLQPMLQDRFAPLVWMKQSNGLLRRMFVVWW